MFSPERFGGNGEVRSSWFGIYLVWNLPGYVLEENIYSGCVS